MTLKHLAIAALALAAAAPAAAIPGLTVTAWTGIPMYDYYPTASTIDAEMAWTAGQTPASTTVADLNPYGFYDLMGGSTAKRYTGTLNVETAGDYSFSLYADDAARLIIDGVTLTESAFWSNGLNAPYAATISLAAGAHSFDLFAFQTVGGEYLYNYIDGANGLSFDSESVPEPAMLGLFGLGALGLAASRRRKA